MKMRSMMMAMMMTVADATCSGASKFACLVSRVSPRGCCCRRRRRRRLPYTIILQMIERKKLDGFPLFSCSQMPLDDRQKKLNASFLSRYFR